MRLNHALKRTNQGRPPLWLMRQAGRYLPEYQKLRAEHSLRDLFFTPALAAEVTLQPLRRFALDAAILFSDITAIAPALGFDLTFQEGPVVHPYATPQNWQDLTPNLALLDPVAEAARLVKKQLEVPLIGFCGGPHTIATYLTKGEWTPEQMAPFLDRVCDLCILTLQQQIAAGADAVQIFDSWATECDNAYLQRYLKRIIDAVDRPVILFMRGSSLRAEELAALGPTAISLDWTRPISDVRKNVSLTLQGNLHPDLLFAPLPEIKQTVRALLEQMRGDPAFILNLGHGIKPGTPLEAVQTLVDEVTSFS